MLIAAVVLPEVFSARHFSDPTYHLHTEILLRGIDANGVILVDANDRIFNMILSNIEALAGMKKTRMTYALFEELLKKKKDKVVRFVTTRCSMHAGAQQDESCATVASHCRADALIIDPEHTSSLAGRAGSGVRVIPMTEYISSDVEIERRRCFESLPSLDRMVPGEFDRLIVGATRFSRWLRFYDKQIGKGTGLSRFRRGIERILDLWTRNSYFPQDQLSVELFTVVDQTQDRKVEPSVAYQRVRVELVESLARQFGVTYKFRFKRDPDSITHPRHLQTQSLGILFEKGFDFIEDDGGFSRTFIKPDPLCVKHLQEYRQLKDYVPSTP